MIYQSLSKDFFYEDSRVTRLSYYLVCEDETIYTGRAYNPAGIKINICKLIEDWLWNDMPDFREYNGVVVTHEDACKVFSLYDEEGTLLEEYKVLLAYEDWQGEDEILTEQINGHVDPRQKIFWGARLSRSEVVPIKKEVLYLEIEFSDDFHFGPQSGSTTICYTANTYVEISTDSDWFTFEHVPNEEGGCIVFTYTENTDTANTRDANICFTYTAFTGQQVSCFKVTQDQAFYFSVPSSMTENFRAHDVYIPYSTNLPNISENISVSFSTSGIATFQEITETGCTIHLNQNSEETPRTVDVIFTTPAGVSTTTILQERWVRYFNFVSLPAQNLTADTAVVISFDTNYTTAMIESLTFSTSDPDAAAITGVSDTEISVFFTLPPDGECDTVTVYAHSGNTLIDTTEITVCNDFQYPSDLWYTLTYYLPWYETGFTIPANTLSSSFGNVSLSRYTSEYNCPLGATRGTITYNLSRPEDLSISIDYQPTIYGGPTLNSLIGNTEITTAETATLITSGAFNQYGDFVMTLTQNENQTPRFMGVEFVSENNVKYMVTVFQYEKPGASGIAFVKERTSRFSRYYSDWTRVGGSGTYAKGVMSGLTQGTSIEGASSTSDMTVSSTRYFPVTGHTVGDTSLNSTFGSLSFTDRNGIGSFTGKFKLKNSGVLPKIFAANLDLADTSAQIAGGYYAGSGGTIVFIQEAQSEPGSGTTFPVRIARGTRAYNETEPGVFVRTIPSSMYGVLYENQSLFYSGSTGTSAYSSPESLYFKSDKFILSYPVSVIRSLMFSNCLLEYIGIPEGVKELRPTDYATDHNQRGPLEGSMYLKEVDLPSTITYLRNAFRNCPKLTRINYNGTMAQWNNIPKENWNDNSPNIVVYCTDGNIYP